MTVSPSMLRLVALTAFCSMASMRICDPMLVTLSHEFSITPGEASAVVAAFAVAYGVLQLIYGPLGDRYGKLRIITLAALGCTLLSAASALAPNFTSLVLARAAMGAAAAGIIPLSMAWIGDQVPYVQRQETLARLMVATVTGMMAGQWFGGFASEVLSWRWALGTLTILFGVASAALWTQTRQQVTESPAASTPSAAFSLRGYVQGTMALLHLPRVRWVLGVVFVEGALAFGTLAFVPAYLVQHLGLSATQAGGLMVFYGVGGLVYSLFAKRWLRLLKEKGLALGGALMLALGWVLLVVLSTVWGAALACLLSGLGFYMLHNTLQVQATQMAPQARGTGVTLFACLLFLGQSAGVFAVSFTVDQGWLETVFLLGSAALALLGVWIARGVQGHVPPAATPAAPPK